MNCSPAGLDLIKKYETFSPKAYWDVSGWSIGWGSHDVPGVTKDTVWTLEQADEALASHIPMIEMEIGKLVKVPLNQNQWDALCCFGWNIWPGEWVGTHTLALLNAGDYQGFADALLHWDIVSGKPNAGLLDRRTDERKLFLTPIATSGTV